MTIHIRWMIRRDMERVLEIERRCFPQPWTEEDFLNRLRRRTCIAMTADDTKRDITTGYVLYELHKTKMDILNVAVDPHYQRQGIGTKIVEKLYAKLSAQRRSLMNVHVRESNLTAQLFFRSCGFMATEITRAGENDSDEDGYVFELFFDGNEQLPATRRMVNVRAAQ